MSYAFSQALAFSQVQIVHWREFMDILAFWQRLFFTPFGWHRLSPIRSSVIFSHLSKPK